MVKQVQDATIYKTGKAKTKLNNIHEHDSTLLHIATYNRTTITATTAATIAAETRGK